MLPSVGYDRPLALEPVRDLILSPSGHIDFVNTILQYHREPLLQQLQCIYGSLNGSFTTIPLWNFKDFVFLSCW